MSRTAAPDAVMASRTPRTTSTSVAEPMQARQRRMIMAASLGSVFEWYDFYLCGVLATVIARRFFGGFEASSALALALLVFAAGFVVRPLGALLFGRLGDQVGRRQTFMISIVVMGLATFAMGLLPGYDAIGVAAPVSLVGLRLLQGLALGGEYGGAVAYVAENAPAGQRGRYTAWIQTTATFGLLLSLLAVLGTRAAVGAEAFESWGWRVPFLLSIVLLGLSAWVRLRLRESPAFARLQDSGRTSSAPIGESFGRWRNLRVALLALFGLVAGQAVVWYAGQLYTLFFLHSVVKLDAHTAGMLVAVALAASSPFFIVFGALSDRIGRKPVIATGLALACLGLFPLFHALTAVANPQLAAAQDGVSIVVRADPASCSLQSNPVARDAGLTSGCDIARRALAGRAAHYDFEPLAAGGTAEVLVEGHRLQPPPATLHPSSQRYDGRTLRAVQAFRAELDDALSAAGYPTRAPAIDSTSAAWWGLAALLTLMGIVVAMVYGPTAATLAELFPTRIRYTSMSLPYHLGNGWFGGLLPIVAFALVAGGGSTLQGLWYPVGVAALTLVVCLLFMPETRGRDLQALR